MYIGQFSRIGTKATEPRKRYIDVSFSGVIVFHFVCKILRILIFMNSLYQYKAILKNF